MRSKAFCKFCEKQVLRLQVLDFFTTLDEIGRGEITKALINSTVNESEAERVVDLLVAKNEKFPKPSEIYLIAHHLHEAAQSALPDFCDECRLLTGYVLRKRTIKTGPFTGDECTEAVSCRCPRGRAIAAGAAKYKAEQTPEPTGGGFFHPTTDEEAQALADAVTANILGEKGTIQ